MDSMKAILNPFSIFNFVMDELNRVVISAVRLDRYEKDGLPEYLEILCLSEYYNLLVGQTQRMDLDQKS